MDYCTDDVPVPVPELPNSKPDWSRWISLLILGVCAIIAWKAKEIVHFFINAFNNVKHRFYKPSAPVSAISKSDLMNDFLGVTNMNALDEMEEMLLSTKCEVSEAPVFMSDDMELLEVDETENLQNEESEDKENEEAETAAEHDEHTEPKTEEIVPIEPKTEEIEEAQDVNQNENTEKHQEIEAQDVIQSSKDIVENKRKRRSKKSDLIDDVK